MSEQSPAPHRRWPVLALWAVAAVVIGLLAWTARYSPDLRGMLPQNDPAFVREMDFYARQGATRVLAFEAVAEESAGAAVTSDAARLAQAKQVLRAAMSELGTLGLKPFEAGSAAGIARAGEIIRSRLPALATPELLAALELNLGREKLDAYVAAFKERALRPEDAFTASAARRDLLGATGRLMEPLLAGLNGSERDGELMVHSDGMHLLGVLEVPFEPAEMSRTKPLMEVVDRLMTDAAKRGVRLEAIGGYRHFRDNLAAVYSDLNQSMPLAILLIGAVLFSLIPNLRAMAALHLPALLGMAGGVAAVTLLGLEVPLPLLGFAAGMLGVAVDYGQHVVCAIRAGEGAAIARPLITTYLTTAAAFAVLLTSSVPGIRCVGIIIIAGLGIALAASLTLLPRLLPRLSPRDRWLAISTPLLATSRRRPLVNWIIAGVLTAAMVPGVASLTFNSNLRSYDGSRPETWRALEGFLTRWGTLSSSDFLVGQDAELGRALDEVATRRTTLGYAPSTVELLLPGAATQRTRIAAWNAFWTRHGETFASDLAAACKAHGLRFQAFTETVSLYRPTTATPTVALADWAGTPVDRLLRSFISTMKVDGAERWQVASPMMKLAQAEVDRCHGVLGDRSADAPVWLASREHIGHTLVAVVANDLGYRSIAIALVVIVVAWLIERKARTVLAVLLPPALALLWTFGTMGWLGIQLDPFAVLAAAFIGGIGIDSAVFMAHDPRPQTLSPVLVASITTIVGMVSLIGAQHPSIATLGMTLTIGMSCCLVASVLITPVLARDQAQHT